LNWGLCPKEIDTLEQQKTERIETEGKDIDGIQITNVYASCPVLALWGGHNSALIRQTHVIPPAFIFPLIN
jgi:hypothetical protein